jgi:hypothetical protein
MPSNSAPELELRIAGVEGPAWRFAGALRTNEGYLSRLRSALAEELTTDDVAACYQRRDSFGFRVMLAVTESAVQTAIRRNGETDRALRDGLTRLVPATAYVLDGPPSPHHRKRCAPGPAGTQPLRRCWHGARLDALSQHAPSQRSPAVTARSIVTTNALQSESPRTIPSLPERLTTPGSPRSQSCSTRLGSSLVCHIGSSAWVGPRGESDL